MTDDKMPPLPLIPGAVLGLYGEDGVCLVRRGSEDSQIARKGGQRLVTEKAARAYAAEQVRELVEALRYYANESFDGYGQPNGAVAQDAIAKHKGTT